MALTRQEIIDYAMLHSGHFVAGFESTFLTEDQIDIIIKRELAIFSKYRPQRSNRPMSLSGDTDLSTLTIVPQQVTKVEPVNDRSSNIFGVPTKWTGVYNTSWRYDKPLLRFTGPAGFYDVQFFYYPEYKNCEIQELSIADDRFLDMVTAKIMSVIGRSRRSYSINGLSIGLDFDSLISDGDDLYSRSIEAIQEGSDFWLAVL